MLVITNDNAFFMLITCIICGTVKNLKPSLAKNRKFCTRKCEVISRIGKPSGMKGKTHSKESLLKMSLAHKGRKHTEEAKQKISKSHMGIRPSEETKKKLSEIKKGHNYSPKTNFKKGENCREKSPRWKGDDISNDGVHQWIKINFGRPDHCDICGKTKKDINSRCGFHWSNKRHLYTRDLSNWWQLCAKCHSDYDYKFLGKKTKWDKRVA